MWEQGPAGHGVTVFRACPLRKAAEGASAWPPATKPCAARRRLARTERPGRPCPSWPRTHKAMGPKRRNMTFPLPQGGHVLALLRGRAPGALPVSAVRRVACIAQRVSPNAAQHSAGLHRAAGEARPGPQGKWMAFDAVLGSPVAAGIGGARGGGPRVLAAQ